MAWFLWSYREGIVVQNAMNGVFLCWYSSASRSYAFSLSYRNLTAAYLCRVGRLDIYGIMVSVNVGFL